MTSLSIEGTLIQGTYNIPLVMVSILAAVLASFTALYLASSFRECDSCRVRLWTAGCSFSLGGGIWSMHFIAMLAWESPVPVKFGTVLTVLSFFLAVIPAAWAFHIANSDQEVKRRALTGGCALGAGISLMHYCGILAMQMPATMRFNGWLVGLSVFIAVSAAMVALWLFIRFRDMGGSSQWNMRCIAAVLMGSAIAGMHYTGMAAVEFISTNNASFETPIDRNVLATAISVVTFLIFGIAIAAAILNRRFFNLNKRNEDLERRVGERTQELRKKNEELDSALAQAVEYASLVQKGFLPEHPPELKEFIFAAKTFPAKHVGGDFYDFVVLDENKLAVLFGDVSGKGVPAALYMARLISDFRYLCRKDSHPQSLMSKINCILSERSDHGMFATAIYLLLDIRENTIELANAGHHSILIRDEKQQFHEMGKAGGIPLGIFSDTQYNLEKIQLKKGNLVVLYTDGVTEPKDEMNNEFGLLGLEKTLNGDQSSPEELIGKLRSSIQKFTHNAPPHDDLTILAFQVL